MDYQNGKIYRIVCNKTGLQYVGSTTQPLCKRLSRHKSSYNRWLKNDNDYTSSFKIIENSDYDIVLIENYKCNTKDELHKRERYYIENMVCVNKIMPILNEGEESLKKKEYRLKNAEAISIQRKEFRSIHKTELSQINKIYRDDNKDKINKQRKKYRESNKEVIKERKSISMICECGTTHRKDDKARHLRSIKHIKFIEEMK